MQFLKIVAKAKIESKNKLSLVPALLDPNFSAKPILQFLIAEGLFTYVVGKNNAFRANSRRVRHLNEDYSDSECIANIVKSESVTNLVPGCTDKSYQVCAEVSEKLSLPFPDSSRMVNVLFNKLEFASLCKKLKIPVPKIFSEIEIKQNPATTPIIVKPVDSYSGNGISHLRQPSWSTLEAAIINARKCSISSRVIIQEFIEGKLFSVSCFFQAGEIVCAFFVREYLKVGEFKVETSYVDQDFDSSIQFLVKGYISSIAKELGINKGLIHIQFIISNLEIFFIEATRRMPGDLFSHLIELSTGFPYAENYARAFLDMPLRLPMEFKRLIVRKTLSSQQVESSNLKVANHYQLLDFFASNSIDRDLDPGATNSRSGVAFLEYLDDPNLLEQSLGHEAPIIETRFEGMGLEN